MISKIYSFKAQARAEEKLRSPQDILKKQIGDFFAALEGKVLDIPPVVSMAIFLPAHL